MSFVGNVHLVSGGEECIAPLLKILEREGFEISGNPDLDIRTYTSFGVEEARELCERSMRRALASPSRVFIVAAAHLTNEAQNTMLKTLEEAPGHALFFIIVPSPQSLLPTLRSRAQVLALDTAKPAGRIDPEAFLSASPQQRLDMLKILLERDDDDRRDIAGIVTFLSSLERMLSARPKNSREAILAVYRARKYSGDRGSLLKPLLESVALLV